MTIRTRLSMTTAALLAGAITSACGGGGGGGAPTDASEKDFCDTQTSLFEDLMPDDMSDPEVPAEEEMAQAVKDWGARLEVVGTPEDIPDDARQGFERIVEQANDIDPSDFSVDKLDELDQGGAEASAEVKKQAEAFNEYLFAMCGNPMDKLLTELPELPGSTE